MSDAVSPSGPEAESSPSDYEVFDFEDFDGEYPYHRIPPNNGSFQEDEENDDEDGIGTPLNLELALLLNQGIVSKAKANFGISKNIETLEKSTVELSESISSSPKRKPKELAGSSSSSFYKRDPDLYLRRNDDDDCSSNEEEVDFVSVARRDEAVFENRSTEQSPLTGGPFRFTEPTTSFHSAYGYDNERLMFEGIP